MRALVVAASLLLVSAAPAFAQAGAVTAGFNVGIAFPITEDLKDIASNDLALAGHVTVGLARALAFRGEFGRSQFAPNTELSALCDVADVGCTLRFDHLSAGLQWGGFGDRGALGLSNANVRPYGFIAIGAYTLSGDLADADNTRKLGINGGFGFNIAIQEHVGIQADIHIHALRPEAEEQWNLWAVPSIGVWVAF